MKSSSGEHFIALDHVRALAAFIVFSWHFTHAANGYPVAFSYVPAIFPFAILDEGHTGVALFMALSGYLFAKLLDGRSIAYPGFLWNRALRLLPLLALVILAVGIMQVLSGRSVSGYAYSIVQGLLLPTLPHGGWSITAEFHFYVLLPLLLWLLTKAKLLPFVVLVAAMSLRFFMHRETGEVQSLAYWTIVGRIDQFVLGMLAYHFRAHVAHRHVRAFLTVMVFMVFFWHFDVRGGFYQNPSYPSTNPVWIILPAIEGAAYAIGIAWYDNSFSHSTSGLSKFVGRIGEYSYSIYLLHFFVVFRAARFVHEHIMDISNFYLACLWSLAAFVLMGIPGYLSYRYIEAPFLKLRKSYIKVSG